MPNPDVAGPKSMDEIMALCKRRGFIFQASEIYGGINGFWDYGPMGAQLKKNLRDAWWHDMVMTGARGATGPDGRPIRIVPLDTCIIQHPSVWDAAGHVAGFNDPMVDCRDSKSRYRADHLACIGARGDRTGPMFAYVSGDDASLASALKKLSKAAGRAMGEEDIDRCPFGSLPPEERAITVGPDTAKAGTLTEPRAFNLMFRTYIGATATEDDVAYLRPETAQGIFINFKNVVDTVRVGVPFGIAQVGTSFRNEVTPRNFTFRSREFEQMEMEFFCHPSESMAWFGFWREWRMRWWESIGLAGDNLRLYDTPREDLAHYAQAGSDVEYRYPFTSPGFGELEGIAHRGSFDLEAHQNHPGSNTKLEYFDPARGEPGPNGQPKGERYIPHVIEPAAGLTRGVLALLCEAYTPDPGRASGVYMRFHPRIAPIKAAVFPLVKKDGMPEKAAELHAALQARFGAHGFIEFDERQTIGKRYARMDEVGCPYCFTIDGETLDGDSAGHGTVTVRDRDTQAQERVPLAEVPDWLGARLGIGG